MGDSNSNVTGHSKVVELLNSEKFSDVEVQVIDGNTHKTFFAHKLILAMNSKEFEKLFYGQTNSPKSVKIFNFKPQTVYIMLQFFYTNKLNFYDLEEARELYSLSKNFGIRNLQELCVEYISKKEISKDNVLDMYECALREKFMGLLSNCRIVVSKNSKAVFESPSFIEASVAVVSDIFQLENLSVDSELDVLNAAIKWAQQECKRQKLPEDSFHLRTCLERLLCFVRFLTLNVEQFFSFVEKYDILNARESSAVTRKLLQPESSVPLPDYFSNITRPRSSLSSVPLKSISQLNKTKNSSIFETQASQSFQLPQKVTVKDSIIAPFQINNYNKHIPVTKVFPQLTKSKLEAVEFPLQEVQKLFSTAFKSDMMCTATISLYKGVMAIYGIELKISQESHNEEMIKVFLNITVTGQNSPKNDVFNEKLREGRLVIVFNQPLKVQENEIVEIEATIEDLKKNRCCVVKDPVYKLNCRSVVVADISMTSNQMNDNGEYFFLISRLNYGMICTSYRD